ncbi:MAG: hypothetical protein M3Q40_10735 [Pseudomonadota bacterium]|nr:hypothetical protein [Pseudomonadota bacterium]
MADHDERDAKQPGASSGGHDPDNKSPGPPAKLNPEEGMEREVGDLDNPDAVEEDGALPGRLGGGLAGG